jgi:hypothetical protein
MTSIKGDPRGILGIPEEDWFKKLAASSDWRSLGVADRSDLDETQHIFAALWTLARPSDIISYPHEFHVVPGSAEARAAVDALHTIGAVEAAKEIEASTGAEPQPPAPLASGASLEAQRAHEIEQMEYRRYLLRQANSDRFSRDIRNRLISYLDDHGVFPLDDSRERLEEIWGRSGLRSNPADMAALEKLRSLRP